MSSRFWIRFARGGDAEAIAEIGVRTWQVAYRGQLPGYYLDGLSTKDKVGQRYEEITSPKSIGRYWVAVGDGLVVGYCHAGPSRDPDAEKKTGELYSIYVSPNEQNKGIGSSLIQTALKYLKDHDFSKATLWVLETNDKTRRWYESRGWKLEGSKKTEARKGFDLKEIRYEIILTNSVQPK